MGVLGFSLVLLPRHSFPHHPHFTTSLHRTSVFLQRNLLYLQLKMSDHNNKNENNPIVEALPPHEAPLLPLSPAALQNLSEMANSRSLSKLLTTITTTLKSLSQVALQLGESFPPGSPVPQGILSALDDTARMTVDSARLVEDMRDTLGSVIGEAHEAARMAERRRRVDGGHDEVFRPGKVGDGVARRYVYEMGRKVGEYEGLDTSK